MRKDFLVDPYQVLEARAAGAGGVLVILRMLPRAAIEALSNARGACRLFVLLEAFDDADIALMHELVAQLRARRAAARRAQLPRPRHAARSCPDDSLQLAPLLPQAVPRVAESGVATPADARAVAAAGYQLALVGSALMQGADPGRLRRASCSRRAARRPGCARCGSRSAGSRSAEAVTAALEHAVDALGFVFAESVRRVTPAQAAQLAGRARGRAPLRRGDAPAEPGAAG